MNPFEKEKPHCRRRQESGIRNRVSARRVAGSQRDGNRSALQATQLGAEGLHNSQRKAAAKARCGIPLCVPSYRHCGVGCLEFSSDALWP